MAALLLRGCPDGERRARISGDNLSVVRHCAARPRDGSTDPAPKRSSSRCWPGWLLGVGACLGRPFGGGPTWRRIVRPLVGSFGRRVCGVAAFWSGGGGCVGRLSARWARRTELMRAERADVCIDSGFGFVAAASGLGMVCYLFLCIGCLDLLMFPTWHSTALHRVPCLHCVACCNGRLGCSCGGSLGEAAAPAGQEREAEEAARRPACGAFGSHRGGSIGGGA